MRSLTVLSIVATALVGAVGCGDNAHPPVTIGGTVRGLAGSGLVLENNGHDDLTIAADGAFTFATPITNGVAYAVSVKTQPSSPSQTCVVTNGTGNASSDVTDIAVTCMTGAFTVGGTVMGLSGMGLVLENNGADALTVAADGTFTFPTPVASGATFDVTVSTQPAGPTQSCTVAGGMGTVGNASVTSVLVNCTTDHFAIGGTISGLDGSVILQDNGVDDLTLTSNGMFSFATPLASGATYSVTVLAQPASPSQTCTVTAGNGMVTIGDVTSVAVTCTTNDYTIGGTVTGLAAGESVILLNSGGDDLMVSMDGDFTFGTSVASGQPYAVTVFADPSAPIAESCVVTNGSGTVGGANVTDVAVTCTPTKFTVGGTVSGLVGSVVLQDNGGDDLTTTADGPFTFNTPVDSGATYSVTVATQPATGTCTVTNGSGTIGGMDVTTVTVTCTSSCRTVDGIRWCYDSAACGEPCNQVCAALGLPFTIDDTTWFNAQSTAPQCQAINDAFGLGGTVQMGGFTYACSEDQYGAHTAPGGLGGPLLCSTYSGCPSMHRTTMDQNGLSCGNSSRRSLCPCQ